MLSSDYWTKLHRPFRMRSPLDCVDRVVGIVGEPTEAMPGQDWDEVCRRLGTPLPADYRKFVDRFGPGTAGALRVFGPGAVAPEFDLFRLVAQVGRAAEDFRITTTPTFTGPYHPQEGGLIPWGRMGGMYFFWNPAGNDPDAWPVLISDSSWLASYLPNRSFTLFLADYLAGGNAGSGAPLLSPDEGVGVRFVPAS